MPRDISAAIDLTQELLEGLYRLTRQASDGLSEQQAYWQPASESNSIGWPVWHMMRRRDYYSAVCHGEPHVWTLPADGAERVGRGPEDTGYGDSRRAGALPSGRPSTLCLAYAEACQQAALDRVARLTAEMLDKEYLLERGTRDAPRLAHAAADGERWRKPRGGRLATSEACCPAGAGRRTRG